jgi:hypothetical protein
MKQTARSASLPYLLSCEEGALAQQLEPLALAVHVLLAVRLSARLHYAHEHIQRAVFDCMLDRGHTNGLLEAKRPQMDCRMHT